jgi:ABC-type histidine transport system ATPase subunit
MFPEVFSFSRIMSLVSHEMKFAYILMSRATCLRNDKLEEEGLVAQVFGKPNFARSMQFVSGLET